MHLNVEHGFVEDWGPFIHFQNTYLKHKAEKLEFEC